MKRRKVFDDGLSNALEFLPQLLDLGDRAFVTDFFGPLSISTKKEQPDEEVFGFLLTNTGWRSLFLAGGLFDRCRGPSEGLVNGADDEG